jgi:hypothetical protein
MYKNISHLTVLEQLKNIRSILNFSENEFLSLFIAIVDHEKSDKGRKPSPSKTLK